MQVEREIERDKNKRMWCCKMYVKGRMSRRPNTGLGQSVRVGVPRVVTPRKGARTVHSQTMSGEPNQLQQMLKLFHVFLDKIMALTTHNGGDYAFRTSLSQESSLVETAFGAFFRMAMQFSGTVPMLRQARKSSDVGCSVPLKKAAGAFMKQWHAFAESLVAARVSGPASIIASISDNVKAVVEALDQFLNVKPEANSIHDSSVRLAKTYQQQIGKFYDDISEMEALGEEQERVRELCADIKDYSRRLSESFKVDFMGCGLTYTELSVLMTKAFSACSDIIHGLKASVMFNQDMRHAFDAFDEFQEVLEAILKRLNLPTTLIYRRSPSERNFSIESVPSDSEGFEEEEDEFEGIEDVEQVIDKGATVLKGGKGGKMLGRFMRALRREVSKLTEKLNVQKNMCSELEAKMEKSEREYEEMLAMEKSTNLMMNEELEKLHNEARAKDKEIEYLRKREQDNEFKKCLREVARQLGGVVKEESVKFDHDEDDDQLIKYVNALSVYVIEKKCVTCGKFAEREDMVKKALLEITPTATSEDDVLEICQKAKDNWTELAAKSADQEQQIDSLKAELAQLKAQIENVCQNLGSENSTEDIGSLLANSVQEMMNQHQEELKSLREKMTGELNDLASKFKQALSHFVETEETESVIDDALTALTKFTALYEDKTRELQNVMRICGETRARLAKFLGIEQQDESLEESFKNMLTNLEERPNPLKPRVTELEERNNQLVMSIHILANRLKGTASIESDKDLKFMTTRELTEHVMWILDKIHDIFDQHNKTLKVQDDQLAHMRTSHEALVLLMKRYLNEEAQDISQWSIYELILRARELCERITDPSANPEYVRVEDINDMFESTWPMVVVSSTTEPKHYIPEILSAFTGLYHSVQAMKPFSDTLTDMFGIVDFNNKCFDSSNQEFDQIQQKVIELHRLMKDLSPTKVNEIVFNVMERFVTISWTFLDVAAGRRSEAFVTREKC